MFSFNFRPKIRAIAPLVTAFILTVAATSFLIFSLNTNNTTRGTKETSKVQVINKDVPATATPNPTIIATSGNSIATTSTAAENPTAQPIPDGVVVTDDTNQVRQLRIADTTVTVYMPENIKNEPTTQLIVALTGQNQDEIFKQLTLYAEQEQSIMIIPDLNYSQGDSSFLLEKINTIVVQLQDVIHTKVKKQLEFYAPPQRSELLQNYAKLYPQNTLGIIKSKGNSLILNKTALNISSPEIAFGEGKQ